MKNHANREVAKLVAWLRERAAGNTRYGAPEAGAKLFRAAELLQRQAPVLVSVSERMPESKDCDAEGRCWCFTPQENIESSLVFHARWILSKPTSCDTHWLPAHALPLPEVGE